MSGFRSVIWPNANQLQLRTGNRLTAHKATPFTVVCVTRTLAHLRLASEHVEARSTATTGERSLGLSFILLRSSSVSPASPTKSTLQPGVG